MLDERPVDDLQAQGIGQIKRRAAGIARRDYEDGRRLVRERHYQEAVLQLTRASTGLQASLGAASKDTLEAKAALGDVLRIIGRVDEAVSMLAEVVDTAVSTFGQSARITLRVEPPMPRTKDVGKASDALEIMQSLVPDMQTALGFNHPDTLEATANLATLLNNLGNYNEAVSLLTEVISRSKVLPGPDIPRFVLTAEGNLASALANLGRLEEAKDLLDHVTSELSALAGEGDPDSLAADSQLAQVLWQIGEIGAAASVERRVVDGRRRVLGPDHPDTLRSRNNLAYWHGAAADVSWRGRGVRAVAQRPSADSRSGPP